MKKILWICLGCVTVVGIVTGTAALAFGEQLLSIYITDSQEAIACGVLRMSYLCVSYFLLGMLDVSTGTLRGMGASVVPMIISVLGICGIRIGWIYSIFQIEAFHTPQCLYLSYPLSWVVTFAAQFVAFFILFRRHIKKAAL